MEIKSLGSSLLNPKTNWNSAEANFDKDLGHIGIISASNKSSKTILVNSRQKSEKILLIDNDMAFCSVLSKTLEEGDFVTVVSKSGMHAIEAMERQAFDFILCEMIMPNMDGFAVLKKVLHNSRTARIPFFFMSSQASRKILDLAVIMGAKGYFIKPIGLKVFQSVISNYVKHTNHS